MREGTTDQEAHSEATVDPQPCVQTTSLLPTPTLCSLFFFSSLEDAIKNALKNYLPRLESTSDARVEFYNKFKCAADEHDSDLLNKYGGDLDITLIFVGLPPPFVHFGRYVKLTFGE